MNTTTESLLDHLQEQGYEPQAAVNGEDWYDLTVSGIGSVRLCVDPSDEYRTDIHAFDKHWVCEWSVTVSPGTPDAAIIAVLEAAERRLAAMRGGPVTPAQEEATPVADAEKLAAIRELFSQFDWEFDDRQYALEKIQEITEDAR